MSVATESNTIPGFAPRLAALFRYAEPRRPVRRWMRAALLTMAALIVGQP
jgi:hypothetical protein